MNGSGDERKEVVSIDVSNVTDARQLHGLLKENLGFPDFCGMNWNAFWDAITGLAEMPRKLVFVGWENVLQVLPEDAAMIRVMLDDLGKEYPGWECEVKYRVS